MLALQKAFKSLSAVDLRKLDALLVDEHFSAGDHIFRRVPEALYVLVHGAVFLFQHFERAGTEPHLVLREGAVFGERAVRPPPGLKKWRHVPPSPPTSAEAVTDVRVRALPEDQYDRACALIPDFETALMDSIALRAMAGEFLEAARGCDLYKNVGVNALLDLFSAAELLDPKVTLAAGPPPMGVYFFPAREVAPGFRLGDSLIHHLGAPSQAEAVSRALQGAKGKFAHTPMDNYRALLGTSPALRRGVFDAPALRRALFPERTDQPVEVLLLRTDAEAPRSKLTSLLAETIVTRHRDRVMILRIGTSANGDRLLAGAGAPRQRAPIERASVAASQKLVESVRSIVKQNRGRIDYLFLDPDPEVRERVEQELQPVVTKLVFLTRDACREAPVSRSDEGSLQRVVFSILPTMSTSTWSRPEFTPVFPRGGVRLSLDLSRFEGAKSPTRLSQLTGAEILTFERWARALTDRRVGLALGGGGVLGYAHLALLRALVAEDIPIDMISGVSFGSLVGAFFCAEREVGLQRLFSAQSSLHAAVQFSFLSSHALTLFVDGHLGPRRLQSLERPLFPVATELESATEFVVTSGTLGQGVRASSGIPGVFAPVVQPTRRLADGGVVNNVPESTLTARGANLIVASNVLADVPTEAPRKSFLPFDLDFFRIGLRRRDIVRSLVILLTDGGAHDAFEADESFAPTAIDAMPWDYSRAPQILRRAEDLAERVAAKVKRRWESLQGVGLPS
jgi:predicted acylesterase/phospholipase RssA